MPKIYKRDCNVCGKNYKSPAPKYCSRACWYVFYRKNFSYRFKNHKPRVCVMCKEPYTPTNSTGKRCSTCSPKYNKEQDILQQKRFRERYRAQGDWYKKQYWKNPDKYRLASLNRTHQKRANGGDGITADEWLSMKEKVNFTCLLCLKKEPEIKLTQDHIIPVIRGGKHEVKNIRPLCKSCNSKIGSPLAWNKNYEIPDIPSSIGDIKKLS